ncbi:PIN domain-like protein [Crepidotus variabilis]|uniref:PIN domain-like protein n=1 Tax=Crepidotus variabilis TaxID=179855 RepID=A0A9P6E7W0_9AGAR|nr:PIN domain-like protein [Crepidotus variabilis]
MDSKNFWEILRPASQTYDIRELVLRKGFLADRHRTRTVAFGVNGSSWLNKIYDDFSAAEGQQQRLATLCTPFERLCWFSRLGASIVFVFDGDGIHPTLQRFRLQDCDEMLDGFCRLIHAFGFYTHQAPAQAEPELAYLNVVYALDAVISASTDIFLFKPTHVIRDFEELEPVQTGIPGCTQLIGAALVFSALPELLAAVMADSDNEHFDARLADWRSQLDEELRTNQSFLLRREYPEVADAIPVGFPSQQTLGLLYANPKTSHDSPNAAHRLMANRHWFRLKSPKNACLATLCREFFGWQENIIDNFHSHVWGGLLIRNLIRDAQLALPATDRLGPTRISCVLCQALLPEGPPSTYISYKVRVWVTAVAVEAAHAAGLAPHDLIADNVVFSLKLWIPGPILKMSVPELLDGYLTTHQDLQSNEAAYSNILSTVSVAALGLP